MESKLDKIIFLSSIIYIVLPIIIFCFGWLKLPIAIICISAFLYLIYKFYIYSKNDNSSLLEGDGDFWIISVIGLLIWVAFSGIGGFFYQNADFWVRNPIYRDLCTIKWPIIFDLSKQSEYVQSLIGSDNVLFSYYFSWWLTPALISKLLNATEFVRNIVLYFYSFAGVFIVLYLICKIQNNCKYRNLFIFIFFSGLDIIMFLLIRQFIPIANHLEWVSDYFQFSSNTTQLFWVFNQSIPIWIITALVIYMPIDLAIAISSLSFAYSPWCTVGIIPIVVYRIFKESKFKIKGILNCFSVTSIVIPVLMLLIFGLFYTSNDSNTMVITTMYKSWGSPEKARYYFRLVLFLFTEVFCFVFAIGWKEYKKYDYSIVVLFVFLFFVFFYVADLNMHFRAPIPAQFIFMLIILKSFDNQNISVLKKKILFLLLVIGSVTSFTEINRSVLEINDPEVISTFSYIETDQDYYINTANSQFFSHNYEEKGFYYFLKK